MAAKKWQGGKWIRREKRLAINIRDGFQCAYCGQSLQRVDPSWVTLDHLECRVNGGNNSAENLITACKPCNSARGAKPWREYATGGAIERIERLIRNPLNLKLAKAYLAGEVGDPVEMERMGEDEG